MKLIPFKIDPVIKSKSTQEAIPDGVSMIKAPYIWGSGHEGEDVIIAVIDTGIDTNHPDLKNQIIDGRNFTLDYDGDPYNYYDNNGHGTHVAGTIAAAKNNIGVVGVSPKSKLLIIKALNGEGSGSYFGVVNAINYAREWRGPNGEKVSIISMSLAGSVDNPLLHSAIKQADKDDILIICAAGNEGKEIMEYPAGYPEVIAVGAVNAYADMATFSNMNDEIDLVAPGVGIISTYPGGGYAQLSGTSMAAPHVSGAAALIKNQIENFLHRKISANELYAYLCKRTESLGYDRRKQGHGLLNLMKDSAMIKPNPEDVNVHVALRALSEMLIGIDDETIINGLELWENLLAKFEADPVKYYEFRFVSLLIRKFYVSKL